MEGKPENKWAKLDWLTSSSPPAPPPAHRGGDNAQPRRRCVLEYKPPVNKLLLGVVFFGACALFMHQVAVTNRRGLVINGVVELGVTGAQVFYWCVAGIAAAFVVFAVCFGLPQLWIKRQIVLEDDAITLPGWGFSRAHYRVPWHEIDSVSRQMYQKMTYLKIRHCGRTHAINSTWLPSEGDISTVEEYIERHCGPLR